MSNFEHWPENTDTKLFILADSANTTNVEDVLRAIEEKWPAAYMCDVMISSENIQLHSLGYDLHDPSDYANFIVLTHDPKENK